MRSSDKSWVKVVAALMLLPVAFLFVTGWKMARDARTYSTATRVSYQQFRQKSPTEGRYTITGCRIDLSRSVVYSQNNVPVTVYAPVFDAAKPDARTTFLYAEMDDSKTLSLILDSEQQKRYHSGQEADLWHSQHRGEFFLTREVSGLVSKGMRSPTQDLDKEFGQTAEVDFHNLTFIADGWQPNASRGSAFLLIASAWGLVCVFLMLRQQ